jgi:predicted acylesterase/phospholipase RssA
VITIAIAVADQELYNGLLVYGILLLNLIGYNLFYPIFEKIKRDTKRATLLLIRNSIWLASFFIVILLVYFNHKTTYLFLIPVLQVFYLYLVITRRKISETSKAHYPFINQTHINSFREGYKNFVVRIFTDPDARRSSANKEVMIQTEKNIFFWFSISSIIAILIYVTAVFSLTFSKYLTPLPIILLSFGVLLGAGNIITLFSIKQKINFHFLFLIALLVAGFFNESHYVMLTNKKEDELVKTRPTLRNYFTEWIKTKQKDASQSTLPVYFVLADGGASRSAYWTASVLSSIEEATSGEFSKNIFCLSGASGGSLGNVAFWHTIAENNLHGTTELQEYLANDFLSFPLVRLMGPDIILPIVPFHLLHDRAEALERSMQFPSTRSDMGAFMQENFASTFPAIAKKDFKPIICINATRMQDASPAVLSNIKLDTSIFGNRIDILDNVEKGKDISIATAVVLGARFPYFSPAGRLGNDYFVDGGYFDNSGAGVVHEMILDLQNIINDSLALNPNHPYKKIRFHIVHITNKTELKIERGKTHPLVNDLAAPIKTILGSYSSQTDFNNLRLQKYLREVYKNEDTYHTINLYKEGEEDRYPMNWSISSQSLKSINSRLANHESIEALINLIQAPN